MSIWINGIGQWQYHQQYHGNNGAAYQLSIQYQLNIKSKAAINVNNEIMYQ
jgi:hypothetical protein